MDKSTYLPVLLGILLIPGMQVLSQDSGRRAQSLQGAVVRGDTSVQELALVFTGDAFADGGDYILRVLDRQGIRASFFLTGNFYRNPEFEQLIQDLIRKGHYLGAHSDRHLLYCSWENRDSLLLSRNEFRKDLRDNYRAMETFGISKVDAEYFLPPYEWYNDSIASWSRHMGLQLINLSYGTLSQADYTVPGTPAYRSSREIYTSILEYEESQPEGLNGFILLLHIGTDAARTDKFYFCLDELIGELKLKAYAFKRIDELLGRKY